MLELGIDPNLWPWVWLLVAVAVSVVELTVLGGSLMVLPFAVSGLVAAVLGFSGVDVDVQWAVFVLGGGALFVAFWRYQSLVQEGNVLPPGVGAVRLVGMTAVVSRDIDPVDPGGGRVIVLGDTWTAVTDGDGVLPAGTQVRITDVEGTRVRVEPATPGDPGAPDDRRDARGRTGPDASSGAADTTSGPDPTSDATSDATSGPDPSNEGPP